MIPASALAELNRQTAAVDLIAKQWAAVNMSGLDLVAKQLNALIEAAQPDISRILSSLDAAIAASSCLDEVAKKMTESFADFRVSDAVLAHIQTLEIPPLRLPQLLPPSPTIFPVSPDLTSWAPPAPSPLPTRKRPPTDNDMGTARIRELETQLAEVITENQRLRVDLWLTHLGFLNESTWNEPGDATPN